MSYSETITKADLTNILNKVLPQSIYIQSWEYVGDIYWGSNTWTVPDDGFIEVTAEPSAANWYLRISDTKAPDTGWSHRMSGANSVTVSQVFFVKKGAVLGTYSIASVTTVHVYYYRFVLKETMPAPTSVTLTNSTYSAVVDAYKYNGFVTVEIRQTSTVSLPKGSWTTIATLPEGYRPITQIDLLIPDNNTSSVQNNSLQCRINTSGAVMVWAYSNGVSTNQALGSVSFLAAH